VNVENLKTELRIEIFKKYKTCTGRTDIYIAFIENALKLLKVNATLSFIIPYAYTNQNYGTLSRELLIKEYFIREILDTTNYLVFDSANVKNVILSVKNKKCNSQTQIKKALSNIDFKKNTFVSHKVNQNEFLTLKDSRLETKDIRDSLSFKHKLWVNSNSLSEICLVAYGARLNHKTKKIGKDYYISKEFHKGFKKFTEGKNINRYVFTQYGWLNYQPNEHYNPMFPELFENEKLMFINVVKDKLRFALDSDGYYNSHTVVNCVKWDFLSKVEHITVKRNLTNQRIELAKNYSNKFLLSILNSNLISWYFNRFLSESLHFYPDDAKALPIIQASNVQQNIFSTFVNYILFLKNKTFKDVNDQLMPTYFEQIIDGMVYELYFPDLLKKHNREIIKHLGELPEFTDGMSDEQKMKICKTVFDRLNDKEHPVRVNLFYMNSIPEIAIIEGKNENN
jgi:hypothetical protein